MYEMFCVVISGLIFVWVLSARSWNSVAFIEASLEELPVSANLGQSCLATKISVPGPSSFGWFRHRSVMIVLGKPNFWSISLMNSTAQSDEIFLNGCYQAIPSVILRGIVPSYMISAGSPPRKVAPPGRHHICIFNGRFGLPRNLPDSEIGIAAVI